jgi:hypothetical protein
MQKFARVFLKGGGYIDYKLQSDLASFILSLTLQGYLGPDGPVQVMIPREEIRLIVQIQGEVLGFMVPEGTA